MDNPLTLTNLIWNAHANHPSQAGRVIHWLNVWVTGEVQRIALTEVKGARSALKAWAKTNGFRLYQERGTSNPADERGDTAVLIRKKGTHAVKVRRSWLALMAAAWMVFSHRIRHQPRRHRRLVLQVAGRRVRTSAEHWPTRGNTAAWRESFQSAARFLNRRGFALVDGDLNSDPRDAYSLADEAGGNHKGKRPDWVVTNGRGRIHIVELGDGGSDHDALMAVVEIAA